MTPVDERLVADWTAHLDVTRDIGDLYVHPKPPPIPRSLADLFWTGVLIGIAGGLLVAMT